MCSIIKLGAVDTFRGVARGGVPCSQLCGRDLHRLRCPSLASQPFLLNFSLSILSRSFFVLFDGSRLPAPVLHTFSPSSSPCTCAVQPRFLCVCADRSPSSISFIAPVRSPRIPVLASGRCCDRDWSTRGVKERERSDEDEDVCSRVSI